MTRLTVHVLNIGIMLLQSYQLYSHFLEQYHRCKSFLNCIRMFSKWRCFITEFRASESLKLAVLQPRKLTVFAIAGNLCSTTFALNCNVS